MRTVDTASELTSDDIVLSHFTLSRHHDITQRIDAAAGADCRAIGIYIRDFQRLEADGTSEQLAGLLDDAGLSADTQYKILRGNAEKLYRFTPEEPVTSS